MGILEKTNCKNHKSNCNCNCDCKYDIIEVPNGSRFFITYRFNSLKAPSLLANLDSFDMIARYWIKGSESNYIEFEKSDSTNDNCVINKPESIVRFVFNKYKLTPGKLYAKLVFRIADPRMPGGYSINTLEGFTGIILNDLK